MKADRLPLFPPGPVEWSPIPYAVSQIPGSAGRAALTVWCNLMQILPWLEADVCATTVRALAERTGRSDRFIRKGLDALHDEGWITVDREGPTLIITIRPRFLDEPRRERLGGDS
jgi:hypothetical protein